MMPKEYGFCTIDENGVLTLPEKLLSEMNLQTKEERTFLVLSNGKSITLAQPICIKCEKKPVAYQKGGIGLCQECLNQLVRDSL